MEAPAQPDLGRVDLSLLRGVPYEYARRNGVLVVRREADRLVGYTSDLNGSLALRDVALRAGLQPEAETVPPDVLPGLISAAYSLVSSAETVMDEIDEDGFEGFSSNLDLPKDLLDLQDDAPVIRLINALFLEAVKERASDIHVEPYERTIEVRFRVDGVLRKVLEPPKLIQDAFVSRIKVLANLDIAEKRLPQDGRIRLIVGGRDIDIRVSVVPCFFGERVVMRILDRMKGVMSLEELGLDDERLARFTDVLRRTNGIVLVTGPTGSGKTTTLYAGLLKIYSVEKNIITIEDPVEYQVAGVGQIQVNPRIGLTFASGLRSILRQDPDVVMVGEIRDRETAEIAMQASLTGHLVLSTLHTNDAPSALTRLIDMGIESFLVASSLSGVLAQRLVRRLCPACRRAVAVSDAQRALFPQLAGVAELYEPVGCAACTNHGYAGRIGLFEFLPIDESVKDAIIERRDARTIKHEAVAAGMRTLVDDGVAKAVRGLTTLSEVLRVTNQDYAEI